MIKFTIICVKNVFLRYMENLKVIIYVVIILSNKLYCIINYFSILIVLTYNLLRIRLGSGEC